MWYYATIAYYNILTLQVSGLLDARTFVEETLDMAVQHAFVAQHLVDVDFIEPFHVGGEVFDFLVTGGLSGRATVHGDAAQCDQDVSVHCE